MGKEILVVDFGSQTTHLIGRRFKQLGIEASSCDPQNAMSRINQGDVAAGIPSKQGNSK